MPGGCLRRERRGPTRSERGGRTGETLSWRTAAHGHSRQHGQRDLAPSFARIRACGRGSTGSPYRVPLRRYLQASCISIPLQPIHQDECKCAPPSSKEIIIHVGRLFIEARVAHLSLTSPFFSYSVSSVAPSRRTHSLDLDDGRLVPLRPWSLPLPSRPPPLLTVASSRLTFWRVWRGSTPVGQRCPDQDLRAQARPRSPPRL